MGKLSRVGECLYRSHEGMYFALIKTGGKQIKRSLETTDLVLAKRKLRDFKDRASTLVLEREKTTFKEVAERWLAQIAAQMKQSSHKRRDCAVNGLLPFFGTLNIRRISHADIEKWKRERGGKLSERSFNIEMETLRLILDYCRDDLRLLIDHPAEKLKRKREPKRKTIIPTKSQFQTLLKEMRSSASQKKGQEAAAFVEFLAYSGCRLNEAVPATWADINWERGTFLITGGEKGPKNSEEREVPMFPPLERLLKSLQTPDCDPSTSLFKIASAKKAISSACERASLPHFTHHHFRHFFCSNAIEAGVDFKTIAEWLGHKDGGVLVAKTYGHLRAEHSKAMAMKITFDASLK